MADASAGSLLSPGIIEPPPKRRRFSEPQKFLPVAFVSCTICFLWTVYVYYHCCPMLQLGAWRRPGPVDRDARWRGLVEVVVFHYLTAMLLICYVRSILMHPGDIPENDPQWEYQPQDGRCSPNWVPMGLQEMKRTGLRRHCKWCGKYKPDRCHHCRVCKTCILKMDHHCPWVNNCVGFRNYRHFCLFLLFLAAACSFVVAVFLRYGLLFRPPARHEGVDAHLAQEWMLASFLICCTILVALGILGGFHAYLVLTNQTTIEFHGNCAARWATWKTGEKFRNPYDLGVCRNFQQVFGPNPFCRCRWLLSWWAPPPLGDGLEYPTFRPPATLA
mmetsp:Transcript_66579/g.206252  ORF Transcript_66579/g.206252 Transcript_66579/m.206252 type:complete len:331 (+) Transcript_66579:173-1165(+)